eukprot:XP_001709162.1 Hypothetical protein GL50803_37212 [Giardia lamblia ATCC 50803]
MANAQVIRWRCVRFCPFVDKLDTQLLQKLQLLGNESS